MAMVKEMKIGKTTVRIHDDSCVKTPEEVQEILKRIGVIVSNWSEVQTYDNESA